ncbi:hypothetical protein [Streptomyces sp. NPDC101234]|uniref:hypothetical protein n=1 Tax=Streptomyces sp. NPDC101234 TaxID=3366138 RepID=UPI00381DCA7A
MRQTEIADSLEDLFIQLVQKIDTRAENKAEGGHQQATGRQREYQQGGACQGDGYDVTYLVALPAARPWAWSGAARASSTAWSPPRRVT